MKKIAILMTMFLLLISSVAQAAYEDWRVDIDTGDNMYHATIGMSHIAFPDDMSPPYVDPLDIPQDMPMMGFTYIAIEDFYSERINMHKDTDSWVITIGSDYPSFLQWDISSFPDGYDFTLIDPHAQGPIDMRATTNVPVFPELEGYMIEIQVAKQQEVPEFTTIGAIVAIAGAGLVVYRRRK